MTKVVASITISLDGFITGPNDGPGHVLGRPPEQPPDRCADRDWQPRPSTPSRLILRLPEHRLRSRERPTSMPLGRRSRSREAFPRQAVESTSR